MLPSSSGTTQPTGHSPKMDPQTSAAIPSQRTHLDEIGNTASRTYPPGDPQPFPPSYPQPFGPSYPQPFAPGYPQPGAPTGRRWPAIVAVVAVWALLLGASITYVATHAEVHTVADTSQSAARTSTPTRSASPTRTAPQTAVGAVLAEQQTALITNNEAAWLATVDPDNAPLTASYRTLFRNLQALEVTLWASVETNTRSTSDATTVSVRTRYCLSNLNCPDLAVASTVGDRMLPEYRRDMTFAARGGRLVVTSSSSTAGSYPLPWDSTALTVVKGPRVMVAAPPALAGRAASVSVLAERAAAVSDRFARWLWPERYVVYLADADQFATWYGSGKPSGAVGVSFQTSTVSNDVIVDMSEARQDQLTLILTHEFGHVVTRMGAKTVLTSARPFPMDSFVEGIADYIAQDGVPLANYYRLASTRSFIRTQWNGRLDLNLADVKDDVGAVYAIGFLTLRCVTERYGELPMLAFLAAVIREYHSLEQAAPATLGADWPTVSSGCVSYVRQAAG